MKYKLCKYINKFICNIYKIYDLNRYYNFNRLISFIYKREKQHSNYVLIDNNKNYIGIAILFNINIIRLYSGTYSFKKNIFYYKLNNTNNNIELSFDLVKDITKKYYNIFEIFIENYSYIKLHLQNINNIFFIKGLYPRYMYNCIIITSFNISNYIELYKLNNLELILLSES